MRARPHPAPIWDVVFQDVGVPLTSFEPLAHISVGCEVPTPSVVESQHTIMFKPHILKHHIPELPTHPPTLSGACIATILRVPRQVEEVEQVGGVHGLGHLLDQLVLGWSRTNGVNTNEAAAKVINFTRLREKVHPGTFGKINIG